QSRARAAYFADGGRRTPDAVAVSASVSVSASVFVAAAVWAAPAGAGATGAADAAGAVLPSSCSCGTIGSIQRGIHQARASSKAMIEGTRIIRTREASIKTAKAIPMASIFTVGSVDKTKLAKTTTMIAAAVVMTRAVAPIPTATARCG